MFEDGLRFVDAGSWAEAADRFARVLEIRYSAVAAYNYALAQAHLGKLVVAAETLRKVLADTALDTKVRAPAETLRTEVDAKVAWLTLRMGGSCRGCRLRVDDKDWPTAAWGVAVPVDPGPHTLVLARGESALRKEPMEIAPGARVEQVLTLQEAPTPAQVAASSAAAQAPASSSHDAAVAPDAAAADDRHAHPRSLLRNTWFWVAVGVVAAGAVTTAVVLAGSGSSQASAVPGNFSPAVIQGRVTP